MSQLSKLVATLKSQSAYELMGDMPLFTSALAEIEQNFIDLEKKIETLSNPPKVLIPGPGGINLKAES